MKILFQGDSITSSGRSREDDNNVGWGYTNLVKSRLSLDYPQKFEFVNRGIAGNTVADLYARKVRDIIGVDPDFMSILIGTNDYTCSPNAKFQNRFEKVYNMLIEEVLEDRPNIKIMLMEPFVLPGSAVQGEAYTVRRKGTEDRSMAVQRIAEKFGLDFVPLQYLMDEALEKAPVDYWTTEGVHPTPPAFQIIADEWIKAFKKIYEL